MVPLARSESLVVEPIGDELLVFDSQAQRAHSLNPVATKVWRACDGTRDVAALARSTSLDREVVELALADLRDCDLLAGAQPEPVVSRRHVLRRVALTGAGVGLALPVIRSVAAPTPALAASSCPSPAGSVLSGAGCSASCECQDGCCCTAGLGDFVCTGAATCAVLGRTCV